MCGAWDRAHSVCPFKANRFLETGIVPEGTCFPARVVCSEALPKTLSANDRLYYGQYDKKNQAMDKLLKDLTAGRFKNGAVARILAREFWTAGKAPTLAEFAAAWMRASEGHTRPNPEWAFSGRSSPLRKHPQLETDKG
jgi:hypothetical protein